MSGDKEAGVTIMQMELGLDTGPMGARAALDITSDMTTGALHDALAVLGGDLMVETLDHLIGGDTHFDVQPGGCHLCEKIDKAEAKLIGIKCESPPQSHSWSQPVPWCMDDDAAW